MRKVLILMCVMACGLIGCASPVHPVAQGSNCQAECLVCKHNADLACVEINISNQTPRMTYAGKTYYFCSEDCREEFAHNPEKYIPR